MRSSSRHEGSDHSSLTEKDFSDKAGWAIVDGPATDL
jgi:hypothetical protein